jgi:hypothetical protein
MPTFYYAEEVAFTPSMMQDVALHFAFLFQVQNQIPDLRSTLLFVYRYMYVLQISAHAWHGGGVSVAKVAKVGKE